jgi:hypothetical protein
VSITDQDVNAIAQAVATLLYGQAEATSPVPKQPDIGHIMAQTYNKAGDLQGRLTQTTADLAQIKADLAEIKALLPVG